MSEVEKIALFDAYLGNEMSASEKDAFKLSLAQDHELQKEFEAHKAIALDIRLGEEYRQIKSKLESIHKNNISKSKPLFLRTRVWVSLSAAAAIIILLLMIPFKQFNNANTTASNEDYQPLFNGEEEGADDVMTLEEELDTSIEMVFEDAIPDSVPGPLDRELYYVQKEPKGTCFLISNEGYFLTNKHLVRKKNYIRLQQADLDIAFNAEVVYRDSLIDLAILKCSDENAELFKAVPFKFFRSEPAIGDEVFTLGYPKSDIVYTKGDISSETGFRSDSLSYEISMPSNRGNSGAPLFSKKGDLIGMIMANNSRKQSVTYIVKNDIIQERLISLKDSLNIDMNRNYTKRYSNRSDLIKKYRSFIFEVH